MKALSKTLAQWWVGGGGAIQHEGTLLGSWPKPTVTADKKRRAESWGEILNVKAGVIDFK